MWKRFLFILALVLLVSVSAIYADSSKVEMEQEDFQKVASFVLTSEKQLPILQVQLESLQKEQNLLGMSLESTNNQVVKLQRNNKLLIGGCVISLTVGIGALIYALNK